MRSTRSLGRVRLACVAAGLVVAASAAQAGAIFSEDFDSYTDGKQNATQPGTDLALSHSGFLPLWSKDGTNSIHAVDFGAGNFAVSLFDNNVITLISGIAAATAGQSYVVSYDIGASVYTDMGQATTAGDGLVIRLLREDNTVLASHTFSPGGWVTGPNAQALTHHSFTYTGDGSGAVRLQIGTNTTNTFGGAIDNLSISAVPEPGTLALALLGIAGIGTCRGRLPVKGKRPA